MARKIDAPALLFAWFSRIREGPLAVGIQLDNRNWSDRTYDVEIVDTLFLCKFYKSLIHLLHFLEIINPL